MSATTTPEPVPAAAVPAIVGTSVLQKVLDHLKQPTSVAGLIGLIGGVTGLLTHGLSEGVAISIIASGVAGVLFPDNSTDRIKVLDVANALAQQQLAGRVPVAGKYDAVAQVALSEADKLIAGTKP